MIRPLVMAVAAGAGWIPGLPALADDRLPITTIHGNEAGCKVVKDPDALSEDALVLAPEYTSSYATYCAFETIVSAKDGTYVVDSLCGYEGEDGQDRLRLTISTNAAGAMTVHFADGLDWGPLPPCP